MGAFRMVNGSGNRFQNRVNPFLCWWLLLQLRVHICSNICLWNETVVMKHITSKFIQYMCHGQQLCASDELFRCVGVNAKTR